MPELIYEKAEDVPAAIKSLAVEKDGKFVANVVAKSELDDFRNRNIAVSTERDNLQSIIGRLTTDLSLDPEKLDDFVTSQKEALETQQAVTDGKLVKDTSLAAAVEAKTSQMKQNYEAQINGLNTKVNDLTKTNGELKSGLNRSIVDRAVMEAINDPKSGANPAATRHILRDAYETFSVDENGKLTAKDADGNIKYGSDGATILQPAEWLASQKEAMPFFFGDSQGGGAGGSGGSGGTLTPAQLSAMSPEEKMNYGREHNMAG